MLKRAGFVIAFAGMLLATAPGWSQTITTADQARAYAILTQVLGQREARFSNLGASRLDTSGAKRQATVLAGDMARQSPAVQAAMAQQLVAAAATNPEVAVVLGNLLAANPGLSGVLGTALAGQNSPSVTAQVMAAVTAAGGSTTALAASITTSNPTLVAQANAFAANNPTIIANVTASTKASDVAGARTAVVITFVNPVNNTQTAQNGTGS